MASTSRLAHHLREELQKEGYRVHCGGRDDGPKLAGRFWFTWSVAGMVNYEAGPSCAGSWEAWASALDHRLANSRIGVDRIDAASTPLEPFHAATIPPETLDVRSFAARHRLSQEVAASQIERLRAQSIFMNDRYQVNVQRVRTPFGDETGDMFWLSIKRRDRTMVHDWRDLQQIKNMIVGDEHEGFEVYPRSRGWWTLPTSTTFGCSLNPRCGYRWAICTGRCWTAARQRRSVHGGAASARRRSVPPTREEDLLAAIAGGAKPLPGSELGVLGIHGVGARRGLVDSTQNFEDSMSGM